uniref:Uncharacterized protein n=1 Tax=Nelumbo nucifera TaxID=4432 RepID=A0A822ZWX9_NELNU|nr:TPA_asm: hypothetical protein HUJ06_017676 [Nelumbo nucifera]
MWPESCGQHIRTPHRDPLIQTRKGPLTLSSNSLSPNKCHTESATLEEHRSFKSVDWLSLVPPSFSLTAHPSVKFPRLQTKTLHHFPSLSFACYAVAGLSTMTTSFPSSESCNACHGSAGTTSCGHASTFLSLLYMPQVANDHDSSQSAVTFSPAKHYKSGFDELSFFEHDDAVTWLHGSGPSPEKEPVTKYQESLHNNSGYLTLGVCSTTTSLSDSSHGSSPAEVSVFGKAASSATVVPSSRRMYLDASSGNTYSNDMGNSAASTGQGDNAAQREARILSGCWFRFITSS